MVSYSAKLLRASRVTRILVLTNLVLVLFLFSSVTRPAAERMFKAVSAYAILPWVPDIWAVASTLLASGLFAYELLRARTGTVRPHLTRARVALDGLFIGVWWLILAGICLYGFALGHAG